MTDRDRLKRLFDEVNRNPEITCPHKEGTCRGCEYRIGKFLCDGEARKIDYLIANGVTVNEWISVDERLPETFGNYLTCDKKGNVHVFFYHPSNKYPFNITPYDRHYYMPTHWMPLPEPPKEVDNAKID